MQTPAEEFLPELVGIGQAHLVPLAIRPVAGLARRGNEALALLARRLRQELLGPQAEAADVVEADLVAPLVPAGTESEPELEPGIAFVEAACLGHLKGA